MGNVFRLAVVFMNLGQPRMLHSKVDTVAFLRYLDSNLNKIYV